MAISTAFDIKQSKALEAKDAKREIEASAAQHIGTDPKISWEPSFVELDQGTAPTSEESALEITHQIG